MKLTLNIGFDYQVVDERGDHVVFDVQRKEAEGEEWSSVQPRVKPATDKKKEEPSVRVKVTIGHLQTYSTFGHFGCSFSAVWTATIACKDAFCSIFSEATRLSLLHI